MQPRRILFGATYLVTRRCTQRQFLLRPDERVNRAVLYCLAYAANETGVEIHAFVALSNHYHLLVTDPADRIPRFLHRLNSLLARCLNAMRARFGNLFETSGPSYVRAIEPNDVLRQLAYTICNPVSSGLVLNAKDWPGVRSEPSQFGTTVIAEKPDWFFSEQMPDEVPIVVSPPPCFGGWDLAQLRAEVERTVAEHEATCRAEIERSKSGFLGAKRVRNQSPTDSPAGYEKKWKLSPTIQAKRPGPRVEEIRALIAFRVRYRAVLQQFREGAKDVEFPAGTYWMRVFHRQRCERLVSGAVPLAP